MCYAIKNYRNRQSAGYTHYDNMVRWLFPGILFSYTQSATIQGMS